MVKNNYEKEDIQYLKGLNSFQVNDNLTINKFKASDKKIYEFDKYGKPEKYLKFSGKIENKKVNGYININDNNIYQLKETK